MEKILTIAISVYNLEKYIADALDSIVESRYISEIEVLVVNDGSRDNSSLIIKKYTEKYPNSIILFDKDNEGQGSTYNLTIEKASGKYYRVLDGDDWYDTIILDKFIEFLKKCDSDIIGTDMRAIAQETNDNRLYNLETSKFKQKIKYGQEYNFDNVCLYAKNIDMHHLTVKTQIVRKIHVLQNVSGYSDLEYALKIIPYVNTVTYLNECVYQYRTGRSDQAISGNSQIRLLSMNKTVLREMIRYYNKNYNILSNEKREYIERRLVQCANVLYYIFLLFPDRNKGIKEFVSYDKELKKWNGRVYSRCNFIVKSLRKSPKMFFKVWSVMYIPYKKRKKFL